MECLMVLLYLINNLLFYFTSAVPVYNAEVNGDVTLSPVGISSVRSVVWRFGNNKVAEFDPSFSKEVKIFGNYQGRTTLDKETGKITISKLSLKDNGTFSVEVDSVLTSGWYRLEVFGKLVGRV